MSSAENGRLVWLDDELFDWIAQYAGSQRPVPTGLLILIGKREAAPADPAAIVLQQLNAGPANEAILDGVGNEWLTRALLDSLGVPDASQRRSGGDA